VTSFRYAATSVWCIEKPSRCFMKQGKSAAGMSWNNNDISWLARDVDMRDSTICTVEEIGL
jgi:hypothetical protein